MVERLHEKLSNGVEWAVEPVPDRHAVNLKIRLFAGMADEPTERLGLAYLVQETITKGTERRGGRELSDAFDAIGASQNSWSGRESTNFSCTCLPEFLEEALRLHAEFLRTPTFPDESCSVAVELSRQEIDGLSDEPRELCDKLLNRQAYGVKLGRHALGEHSTLDQITRDGMVEFWREHYSAARMQVTLAGPIEVDRVRSWIEEMYDGFGNSQSAGREPVAFEFEARQTHHQQDTEQEQIGICFPGVSATSEEYATQRVMLSVLSGGMSSRLFAEVREKLGLAYYVGAWAEYPRGSGMIHIAASTTPERCEQTYSTLLREVNRLGEDLSEEELERGKTGILARTETRGDLTSARCSELSGDLFHYGRLVPMEEKLERVRAVTVEDVRRYLRVHPRDRLSVVTLGPRSLEYSTDGGVSADAGENA